MILLDRGLLLRKSFTLQLRILFYYSKEHLINLLVNSSIETNISLHARNTRSVSDLFCDIPVKFKAGRDRAGKFIYI